MLLFLWLAQWNSKKGAAVSSELRSFFFEGQKRKLNRKSTNLLLFINNVLVKAKHDNEPFVLHLPGFLYSKATQDPLELTFATLGSALQKQWNLVPRVACALKNGALLASNHKNLRRWCVLFTTFSLSLFFSVSLIKLCTKFFQDCAPRRQSNVHCDHTKNNCVWCMHLLHSNYLLNIKSPSSKWNRLGYVINIIRPQALLANGKRSAKESEHLSQTTQNRLIVQQLLSFYDPQLSVCDACCISQQSTKPQSLQFEAPSSSNSTQAQLKNGPFQKFTIATA